MEKKLILVRGVSGSGKSTFAELLGGPVFAADDFFMVGDEYKFDANKLGDAHEWCQNMVEANMLAGMKQITVANTFTTEWEMKAYFELAERHNYKVFTVIVENRHGGTSVHNVPADTLAKQKSRFNIKL